MNLCIKLKRLGLILVFIFFSEPVWAKNVVLPITIDYPLLRSLVVSQWFGSPETEKELINDPKGCRKILISDPVFSQENSLLRFEIKVRVKAGFYFMNTCYLPFEWEGYVVFFQTPVLGPEDWKISLETRDSLVLSKNHTPEFVSGTVWKLIKKHVHAYVDAIRIDVSPSVNEMKSFLVNIFPEKMQTQAETMVDSMKPGQIDILETAVQISIDTDVSSVYDETRTVRNEPLDDTGLDLFIRAWETTDDFIVYMIGSLSNDLLKQDEKQMILETVLDARYAFVKELDSPIHETDFVKKQFMTAWDRLSLLFKHHIEKDARTSPLGALALFSSLDALRVLDAIGPSMGIEISRNGLVRLARQIVSKNEPLLSYSMEIDENLRQTMGLDAVLKESPAPGSNQENKEDELKTILDKLLSILDKTLWDSLAPQAIAAEQKPTGTAHLEKWIPPKKDISGYVKNVRQALDKAADNTLSKNRIDPEYRDLFRLTVHAVAWQESCFRQFEVRKGKIGYLRSYNNTSVGTMQINERVWRGIYNLQKLRWDIHYNMDAGSEIIDLYLNQYVFKKIKEKSYRVLENKDNIARTLYAIYNGGPGEFSKFLERISRKKMYVSDDLFYEKYLWAKNNQWENASICLVGE